MKKKWHKKAISAVLAAGMVLSLAACGGTAGGGNAGTDTNQSGTDGSASGGAEGTDTETDDNSTSGTDSAA